MNIFSCSAKSSKRLTFIAEILIFGYTYGNYVSDSVNT